MDPQTGVVVLGLASAIAWGTADFSGGLAGRRAPILGVVLFSQFVGLGLALAIALVRGESFPITTDLGLAVVGGVLGGVGIGALYGGLAIGRMGVVAPISGVLSAVVPVSVGIVLQGPPGPAGLAGIGLALVAVVLVSSAPSATSARPQARLAGIPADVAIALVAGIALGLLNLVLSRLSSGAVFAPLVLARLTEALLIGSVVLIVRRPWRLARPVWPLVLIAGGLDMAGNGLFILAAQAGRLDIAAILSSLYPVATLVLAAAVLKERVVGVHALGVVAAVAAIVLVRIG
jgi:drug/metabolite transporter (DMT)-like permease